MRPDQRRVVIADAGPLIGLARIGRLDLLPRLFGTLSVTRWVADEVLNGGEFPDLAALKAAFTEPWLQVADLADTDADADADAEASLEECRALINLHQIDMGEASALVLAQQLATRGTAALLLIDEHRGRQAAQHCQVAIIGTAGLLVLAKQAGAVDKVRPLLLALRGGGYFLSDRLVEAVLAQSGE